MLRGHEGRVRQALLLAGRDADSHRGQRQDGPAVGRQDGRRLGEPLTGHLWAVFCGAFSADGRLIITGGEDNTAIVWDAATGEQLTTLAGHTGR